MQGLGDDFRRIICNFGARSINFDFQNSVMHTNLNIRLSHQFLVLVSVLVAVLCSTGLAAQRSKAYPYPYDALTFKENFHDFGTFSEKAGPQSYSFTFVNERDVPVKIRKVSSMCSCARAKWPKKAIKPGKTGKVVVTYLNEDGAKPFDKQLMVYYEGNADYEMLRIRGKVTKAGSKKK